MIFQLINHTPEVYQIRSGDPVAYLVLVSLPKAVMVEEAGQEDFFSDPSLDPPRRSNIYRERAPELPARRSNISRERTPVNPVEIWDLPVIQGGRVAEDGAIFKIGRTSGRITCNWYDKWTGNQVLIFCFLGCEIKWIR